ncbi:MAG: protein kinase [Elusimicrobiota bacterium]|jgi:tRNA A-37 threonylcarbamoyl transferase component Bud32|nr:protein kinase [Elusimicrobiota bacterium]
MKCLKAALLACFLAGLCSAQENEPIMLDGRYMRGSSAVQPNENARASGDMESVLRDVSILLSAKNGDYGLAVSYAQGLINKGMSDPRIYSALAVGYEKLGNCGEAIYNASQAISLRPSDVEALTARAYCYHKKGDGLHAREDIETAIKYNPKYEYAQEVNRIILEENARVKQPKAPASGGKRLPAWFFAYVVCVVTVMIIFMVMRYRGFARGTLDETGRQLKEVNIKEQYHFIRQIGEGGMGKVYEAYDNVLKRRVAVKRIKPELLKSNYVREQFLSEARMVATLHHPCIVEIYTVLETANSLYLVFEYVEGQTLETRLDIDGYLNFDETREVFGSVCQGLAYAHSHNIVHCDLKPGNIMISDSGIAKVMDFGVARKVVDGDKGGHRTVAGTPAYMSPEQQKGFMTKQSDIYSLAICLYEALVGQVPWSVKGFDITTRKIIPPSNISESIPKVIDNLIETSLNDDPAKRIQTVEEFWEILKNA